MTLHTKNPHDVHVLRQTLPYEHDPIQLYHTLCGHSPYHLLLESAEIHSKQDLKSLMLITAALRIVCHGEHIQIEALTDNGQSALRYLSAYFSNAKNYQQNETHLSFTYVFTHPDMDEDARLKADSCFNVLRIIQSAFRDPQSTQNAIFLGGLFAYDIVANIEPLPEVASDNRCPDYVFYLSETLLILDHQNQTMQLQSTVFDPIHQAKLIKKTNQLREQCTNPSTQDPITPLADHSITESLSDEVFKQHVRTLKRHIEKGDIFQVVPSRQFSLACPNTLASYHALKIGNPSPYMFYLHDRDFTLFGASPESALKYSRQTNQVEIYPIAGTRPRGKYPNGSINLDLDGRIELDLRNDKKENAEHMMLVDLARNDVARISQSGTRYVADLLKVDRYSHVMHLVSRVVGQLKEDLDALHAYQACMNMGTLSGAPKIRAMQLIREVEQRRRGSYGGAVGYLNGEGDMDTCIVIRSAYVENDIAYVQAGAGVVYDSDPQSEADETRAKAQAVITAIQNAHAPQEDMV